MSDEPLLPRGAWPWLPFLAVALAPLMMSSGWINIAIVTMLFVYLCVAWNIVGGFAGQFCIGHSLFLAAGAYTSTLLSIHFGVTPWIGMFGGAAVATLIGMFVAWLSFRYALPPLSFALVTIALAMMGYLAISSIDVLGPAGDSLCRCAVRRRPTSSETTPPITSSFSCMWLAP